MEYIPDHPEIARTLVSGYPDAVRFPMCPVCGEETDTFIKSRLSGEILGCDNCVSESDAWEETDEGF